NITVSQAGDYYVTVTNLYGSITSATATVTVRMAATIVKSPVDQIATNGDTVTWSVIAVGTPPINYQWYFNLTNALPDQTNSTLVITNIDPAQAGSYSVIVSNELGSAASTPAFLRVVVLPTIACNPDVTIPLGLGWDFSPPSYADTNLMLQVLGTVTNALCGENFSATRQWLVSDTNGYQVHCSQTVQVLNTNAPLLSCAGDKTVLAGDAWNFDVPIGRDGQAVEALVYDNWTNGAGQGLDLGQVEIGNQVSLAGTQRYVSRFAVEY